MTDGTTGNTYPKMKTGTVGSATVPLTYPPGDANQYKIIVFANAAAEAAYAGNGVTAPPAYVPTSSHGNGYSDGNWKK